MTSKSKCASADDHFHALARAHGLADHVTRKMIDIHHHAIELRKQRDRTIFARWASRAKADPEIGGAGFDANVAYAKRAIDRFGDDRLRGTLAQTGMGNHPELIRMFARVGRDLAPKPKRKSAAEILYPNHRT